MVCTTAKQNQKFCADKKLACCLVQVSGVQLYAAALPKSLKSQQVCVGGPAATCEWISSSVREWVQICSYLVCGSCKKIAQRRQGLILALAVSTLHRHLQMWDVEGNNCFSTYKSGGICAKRRTFMHEIYEFMNSQWRLTSKSFFIREWRQHMVSTWYKYDALWVKNPFQCLLTIYLKHWLTCI